MFNRQIFFALRLLILFFFSLITVHAEQIPDAELTRRQSEQNNEAQSRARNTPDIFTNPFDGKQAEFVLPVESNCFVIRNIQWIGVEEFSWIKSDGGLILNRCIGVKGLRQIQEFLQRHLVDRGYITTRVIISEQNLAGGTLKLNVLAGHINEVRDEGVSPGWAWMILPKTTGALLNQRDLDQALENIRRLTSQQDAQFDIIPGASPGTSDLVIRHPEHKRWSGLLTLDDSGSESTGKLQVGGILSVDSLLHAYDSLTLTFNHNANLTNSTVGSASSSLNWNVPIGYWSLLTGVNYSKYKQTVAGFSGGIVYSGRSYGMELGAGYVLYRNTNSKLSTQFKLNRKVSQSYVDDSEINVQFRDVKGYEANLAYRRFMDSSSLSVLVGIKGSLPKQSKAPGLIVGAPEWDGHYQITTADIGFNTSFHLASENIRYQTNLRIQHAAKLLPGFEYISIGNRYSVRGFDGASSLSSESGWIWRNEMSKNLPQLFQLPPLGEIYLAIDTARLSGRNRINLLGDSLSGAAIGVRGKYDRYNYEFSVGMPIQRPTGFITKTPTFTAFLSAAF
ncbi:ShlB/FhaC/HecB family hemolysin secretion/activation protein [Undibacterium sp. SXout7W]|uniref:ShlB/FhaC/HecB family hemolysin secretion/activation protein n=1 Tax=Undibacterium sp. SXout7W TaxID=3413049 RepID=UPI003BF00BCA